MRVLISGGSGFLGRALTQALLENPVAGQMPEVTWLSRRTSHSHAQHVIVMTYDELSADHVFDVVINLAGESVVGKRWTKTRKQRLFDSRLKPTQTLISWMNQAKQKPSVFVSSSAIGWYGAQGDTTLDESSDPHDEFQHQLCAAWEALVLKQQQVDIRTVILRTGVVLHPSDGMLGKLLTPFNLGVGGRIGTGKQILSWISLEDWIGATCFLMQRTTAQGIYNLTAPTPVTNADFTQTLAKQLRRPAMFPVPSTVLKLALGEMSTLLLDGQNVLPKRLLDAGFEFQHSTLDAALSEQLS